VFIFPSVGVGENQYASNGNAKIGLNENKHVLEVNAVSKLKKVKYTYKKVKAVSKYKKVSYKKVKAAYKYKVKVRYYYKGKLRTKWVYRYYTPVQQTVSASSAAASSVGAYNVVVTSGYVYATGRCTCCMYTDYNYHTRVFENCNPATGHWGVLKFEQGSGKNNPEGMWVATDTDMDFCLVHGKSHDNRGVYLVPYNGVINGINVANGYFTDPVVNLVTNNTNTPDNTNGTDVTNSTNSTNGTNVNK
jgi:hypothetical protein